MYNLAYVSNNLRMMETGYRYPPRGSWVLYLDNWSYMALSSSVIGFGSWSNSNIFQIIYAVISGYTRLMWHNIWFPLSKSTNCNLSLRQWYPSLLLVFFFIMVVSLFSLIISRLNTLNPKQNGCHFGESIFKCVFLNEKMWILLQI